LTFCTGSAEHHPACDRSTRKGRIRDGFHAPFHLNDNPPPGGQLNRNRHES